MPPHVAKEPHEATEPHAVSHVSGWGKEKTPLFYILVNNTIETWMLRVGFDGGFGMRFESLSNKC